MTGDTIAAISTAAGRAAIGIVKISGPKAIPITDTIFLATNKKMLSRTPTFSLIHGNAIDKKKQLVDEVLVSVMRGPKSYTGEDVVEINCHGGSVALGAVLDLTLKNGARLAEPGEFTKRAYLNGRIDLVQAEAVANIIQAKTALALKAAQSQLDGRLSETIRSLRAELMDIAVQLQAAIDFSDEDIEPNDYEALLASLGDTKKKIKNLLETNAGGCLLKDGIKTAIIGGPNVGKSSLLNALLKKERAIVTETAGTTRDLIEEIIDVKGLPLVLQDTAGIRRAFDEAESIGIKLSKNALAQADLVLLVIDSSKRMGTTEKSLLKQANPENSVVVLNKSDLKATVAPQEIKNIGGFKTSKVSALKLTGLDKLKDKIWDHCLKKQIEPANAVVATKRQAISLENGLSYVERVETLLSNHESEELVAFELNNAISNLSEVIGEISTEEVLDNLFSSFCVGK